MKVTVYGWYADFPSASEFYRGILSCRSRRHGSNLSRYCNRELDALAARAGAAAETDPGEADRLWREVYRTINDQAVVVPYTHGGSTVFVSERVGNYQHGALRGPLYDQMWVR
jgi:dipeptide transport system substrate-binding protein